MLSANNYLVNALGDSGSGSGDSGDIRYCINQADLNPGSSITFASSLSGQTLTLANGQLNISANMTISGLGAGSLTINGNNLSRVFDISSKTAQVTISSLAITGGSISGEGGGIYNAGTATLSDCSLSGSDAKYGGGIFSVSGSSLTVSSSTLSGNSASSEGGGVFNSGILTLNNSSNLSNNRAAYGGGICNLDSVTVSSSSLSTNSATEGGGIFNASGGTVMVSKSGTLSANDANYGGGVFNASTLTIDDSRLIGNSVSNEGGGIYNGGSATVTASSSLSNNDATYGGGVFNVSGKTLTVKSSTLTGNSASSEGGGVYNAGTVTIDNSSTLSKNNASYGGGIFNAAAVTLTGSTVTGNSAAIEGGGIYNGGAVTVSGGSTLSTNKAKHGGGVFNVSGKTLTINSSTLSGNFVSSEGGGVYNSGTVTIGNSSSLSGNSATFGGGILNYGTATIGGSSVSTNTASDGGGIWNQGTLTLSSNSTLSGNSATTGGGIYTKGTVTVNDSSLSGNTVSSEGGGIYNGGSVTITANSTLSSNDARYGGGIFSVSGSSLTVSSSTLSGNSASASGGGVYNSGTLTLSDSTLLSNTASTGGGVCNTGSSATLTLSNSTLSGNSGFNGGGLFNYSSASATLTNATIAANIAGKRGGGIDAAAGDVLLHNTLVATNLKGGTPFDVYGTLDSSSNYNLIGDGSGGLTFGTSNYNNLGGTTASPLNPLLSTLSNYGGSTQTIALLPGSPAIDAGGSVYTSGPDQRGKPIVNAPDIGAFESQGFTIAVTSGNNQVTNYNTAFTDPLLATVTAKNSIEPVVGGLVTFTAPASGASAVLSGSPATIAANGTVSVTAVANGTLGAYTVSASSSGITGPAGFFLSNSISASLEVTTLSDVVDPNDGVTSLPEAIAYAYTLSGPQTITFDPSILTNAAGNVLALTSVLPALTGNITIEGPGATVLRVVNVSASGSVFTVDAGATATISGLTISGGSTTSNGGGIYNAGTLTVSDCTLSANTTTGDGGGIYNVGSLTVSDSTLSGNSAGDGGGIYNGGTLTVNNSTLIQNNNQAGSGDVYNASSATATLTNDTIYDSGSIDVASGDVLLYNTLVADNSSGDVEGTLDSASANNLIGDGSGGLTGNNNLLGSVDNPINPLLSSLRNYGGTTETLALLPGSPAINAGSSSYGGSTDQRGENRYGATDIGAFESQGFTLALFSGNNQAGGTGDGFGIPVIVTAAANNPVEPVVGGSVAFTAPTSGASAVLSADTATIGNSVAGSYDPVQAGVTATANGTTGSYEVTASANGAANSFSFNLTNVTPIVVDTVDDENNPIGTTSLRQAITQAEMQSGPQVITFDPSIVGPGSTISLQSALPDLTRNITIDQPDDIAGDLTVANSGGSAFRIFTVDSGTTATITGLTLTNGTAFTGGGGISNAGNLTLYNCDMDLIVAGGNGGGIANSGTLFCSGVNFGGDRSTNGQGGGLYVSRGTVTLNNTGFSTCFGANGGGGICLMGGTAILNYSDVGEEAGNYTTAGNGGGILNEGGTVTLNSSVVSDNNTSIGYVGGGVYNTGTLTINDSSLSGNDAGSGGAIYNLGSLTINNSTLAENNASPGSGGAIVTDSSTPLVLTNDTIAENTASVGGGGLLVSSGGVLLHNTLIAENEAGSTPSPSDVEGILDSASNYNLIGDGSGGLAFGTNIYHNLGGTTASPLNPLLAGFGLFGGSTDNMALLPGSPAIDAGSSAYGGVADQRGELRYGPTDIGAFESQGFTLAILSGDNQSATVNTAFADPLEVNVTANSAAEVVSGGSVSFTAPASGASALLSGSPATIDLNGMASVTATANGSTGAYLVEVSANGAIPIFFILTNGS